MIRHRNDFEMNKTAGKYGFVVTYVKLLNEQLNHC